MKSLAKFVGAALVGAFALLAPPAAQAQVGVSINIGTPDWGPRVPYGTQYYYIPEIDGYYDLYTQQYIVFQDGYWVPLPQLYGYDPYQFHPVIVGYRGAQPWLRADYYRQRYAYQPYRNYGPNRAGYYNGSYGYGSPRYDNYGYSNGRGDRDRDNRGYGSDRDRDNRGYGGDRDRNNRGYSDDRDRNNRGDRDRNDRGNRLQSPNIYNAPGGNQGQPQAPQPQPQPQPGRGGDRGNFGPNHDGPGQPGNGRSEGGGRGNNGNNGNGGRGNGNSRSRD